MSTIVVTHHLRPIWTGAILNLSSIKKTPNCETWKDWCRSHVDLSLRRTRRSQRARPLGCRRNTSTRSSAESMVMLCSQKSAANLWPKSKFYSCSTKNPCSNSSKSNMRCSTLSDFTRNHRSAWVGRMISVIRSGLITISIVVRKSRTFFWKT